MATQGATGAAMQYPPGGEIIAALKRAGIQYVVALPDIVTSDGLLWPIARDPELKLVRICKEDEGVSICAAMSYNGTRAILLMQQTGLMDSLNSIRAIGMDYQLPVCMMVGLQGKEAELKPAQSAAYGVRIIEPVLNAMQITNRLIETAADIPHISADIEQAYSASTPCCFLIGRSPT